MSNYRINVGGASVVLSNSTPCVLWTRGQAAAVGASFQTSWAYARTPGGGVFTFYTASGQPLSPTITMPPATLNDASVGATVLIDPGSGNWVFGSVSSDAVAVGGLPLTTRAAFPVHGYVTGLLPTFAISGTSSTGKVWFDDFYADAMSTIAAVPPGTAAMVEVSPGAFAFTQL